MAEKVTSPITDRAMAKILVVDDRPQNRELVSAILGYRHHTVIEAADGVEALTIAAEERPDLIISDILMPSMDGYEFVRQLRERAAVAHIPVIFSSAHYLTAEARKLAESCRVHYILPKPIEPEDLIRLTDEVLAASQADATVPVPPPQEDDGEIAFSKAHLRLLTNQLAEHNQALAQANERLEAEVAVRRLAEARYRAVVDTAGDAIVVIDENGIIQSFNKAAERIFGYSGSEVTEQNVSMLMPEPYHSGHAGFIRRYRTTGERRVIGFTREFKGRRKDGAVFPLELAAAECCQVGGRSYFTGIMRDITERKRIEQHLRESEAKTRTILETAVDGIVTIDEVGRIQTVNPAAERLFGYGADEMIGQNVIMLMPPSYRPVHEDYLARYRRTGEKNIIGRSAEVEGRRKDGSIFPMELAVGAAVANGGLFVGIVRDITERNATLAAMKAARDEAEEARAEAERANLAKSKFLAAVSHDLRQPAQSMVLFTSLVAEALVNHPQEEAVTHLEHALSGLTKMLDVLLDVSRLDAGCVVPHPIKLPLNDVIGPLAEEYRLSASKKGLRIRTVPTSAATISDPALLERILRNLIENAINYTQTGSILIGCRRRKDGMRVDIIDTGIGIDDENLKQIFDEFFQVGNPERDRTKGLGLGLAIVKRLCRLLDHPIDVASWPRRGTRFSLLLPAAAYVEQPSDGRPAIISGAVPFPTPIVVVIDDEPLIRSGLTYVLQSWGYQVIAAESGAEAATVLAGKGWEPNAIIADYRLRKEETGLDAIHLIVNRVGRNIPSLILTGDTATDIIATVREAGFPLLHKPLATGALQLALTSLFDQ